MRQFFRDKAIWATGSSPCLLARPSRLRSNIKLGSDAVRRDLVGRLYLPPDAGIEAGDLVDIRGLRYLAGEPVVRRTYVEVELLQVNGEI